MEQHNKGVVVVSVYDVVKIKNFKIHVLSAVQFVPGVTICKRIPNDQLKTRLDASAFSLCPEGMEDILMDSSADMKYFMKR